jgi:hypothetical protein
MRTAETCRRCHEEELVPTIAAIQPAAGTGGQRRSDEKRRGDRLKRPIHRARATPGAEKSSRKDGGGVGRAQRGIQQPV